MKGKNKLSLIQIVYVALVGGVLSGIVKFGWEVMFPPRTPERNATNPPQELLQHFGFSSDFTHSTYQFSEQSMPWVSFIIHFSFAIAFALIYAILVNYSTKVAMGYGAVFGIIVWIAFHLIIMPLMGVVPNALQQPLHEHLSELFGHIVWMMVIEFVRRYFVYKNKAFIEK
ncbi:YagU family protein [Staphylococcus gallinarum]|uniref:YagU family protein n=1 Tax=Staphylococcus gallinarum TaxID=1293 RepID=UPI001E5C1109|nr:DUF1440 domain-containing protein [Staphylococcus gallinarum]MCD8899417.1 DUF1440 domain-containing protein [Staphylococcus gallinarum]MCD8903100.1 DUF1440 domain-containing protein [Staphylococcus gallinarum]MEB6236962.1 DUF1440 domain-containing protein [Staphylococcus gallinarum]MEB6278247.1 DUF1440 domain-containing protein [Staphylococcus gallinarum]MEB7038948.1 DUF1440 domain-containing protein [Staphylococcus gallinarum]